MANADAQLPSLQFYTDNAIGCFRTNSQSLTLKKHTESGYAVYAFPLDCDNVRPA